MLMRICIRGRLGEFFEKNPLTSIVRHHYLKSDKLKTENKGFKTINT